MKLVTYRVFTRATLTMLWLTSTLIRELGGGSLNHRGEEKLAHGNHFLTIIALQKDLLNVV